MLSVTTEYVKKRANISREGKTWEGMHKTLSKTKRKKTLFIMHVKKTHPVQKKVLQSLKKYRTVNTWKAEHR